MFVVVTVGFQMEEYMLFEPMTPVNICIVLIAPEDPERDVMVNITTIADTAEGINTVLHM